MAVSKRTRYEVLRRDNHTCRYCGASAPDVVLTVDHVTPIALGGTDNPDNLVAACKDCNAGKSSTSPDAPLVDDVKQIDLQWSGAIARVAEARRARRNKAAQYAEDFYTQWQTWTFGADKWTCPLPTSWEATITRFHDLGVPVEEILHCADVALGNGRVDPDETFRYFAGCVWRVVTEMQEAAKALLAAENADGDA